MAADKSPDAPSPVAPPKHVDSAGPAGERPSKRVARTASDHGLAGQLEQLQAELSSLFADHRQKVLEYKVVVSEGITQSVGVLDMQSERIVELLKTNQELTRAVSTMAGQISKHESIHIDLEHEIVDLRDRRDSLTDRTKSLQDERNQLTTDVRRATDENRQGSETNDQLQHQLERLERENTSLQRETGKFEKERDRLAADVERLTRLREEYVENIKRYKDKKDELTS